jgi:general secretion pathway protein N
MTRAPTLIFLLGAATAAVAATASADSLDDRAALKADAETAYAPAPRGGAEGGVASAGGETIEAGNPLWTVPLSALTATRDRPLFASSRRPPAIATAAAPPPPPPPPAAVAPDPPEKPPLTLVGTIVSPGTSIAIVKNSATEAIARLRVGEESLGWTVRSVAARSIVVAKGAQSVTLALPTPHDAPGAPGEAGASGENNASGETGAPSVVLTEGKGSRH